MITKMRYHEIIQPELDEGRDAPLFHFTDIETLAAKILPENVLRASNPSMARGSGDDGAGKSVSFTRNLNTAFFKGLGGVLIINQTALSHRYKIVPQYGDSPKFASWDSQKEQEERVYSDIAPLNRYVKAVGAALKLPLEDDPNSLGLASWNEDLRKNRIRYRVNLLTPLAEYNAKYNIPIVLKSSIKMNGTWKQDITQDILEYLEKYRDQAKQD